MIVIAGGVAAAVTRRSRSTADVTSNARARVVARYAAESGIAAAVTALQHQLEQAGDDQAHRQAILNDASHAVGEAASFELGDALVRTVMVDASARIDMNAASEEMLVALFTRAGSAMHAATTARAIRRHIDARPGQAQLLHSLDEAAALPGVEPSVITRAAAWLTVDGDGQVNRATAAPEVLGVARGSLVDEPTRIVLIARGWQRGHPLTHEVQAVYAVQGNQLAFVRMRERDL
jgi:hypothetical protein